MEAIVLSIEFKTFITGKETNKKDIAIEHEENYGGNLSSTQGKNNRLLFFML